MVGPAVRRDDVDFAADDHLRECTLHCLDAQEECWVDEEARDGAYALDCPYPDEEACSF